MIKKFKTKKPLKTCQFNVLRQRLKKISLEKNTKTCLNNNNNGHGQEKKNN